MEFIRINGQNKHDLNINILFNNYNIVIEYM